MGGRQIIQALPDPDGDTDISGNDPPTTAGQTVEGNTHIEKISL